LGAEDKALFGKLKKVIEREQFHPTWLALFTNPFYFARKELFKEIRSISGEVSGRVLDVGCGQVPYRDLFRCEEYVGLELDTPENRERNRADIYYDGDLIPVEAGSFDWVFSSQVFEHVFNPDPFLSELYRVLKPNGHLLMTVPFVWDEHEQPFDYARYSSFGLSHVIKKNGFDIVEQKKTAGDSRVIFQMINAYLYKITRTNNPYLNQILCLVLMAPFNVLGEMSGRILPDNKDMYLDNVVLARKGKE